MENKLDKERIAAIKSMSNSERMEKFKTLGAGLSHEGLQFFTDFLDVKSDELAKLRDENDQLKRERGSLANAGHSGSPMNLLERELYQQIGEHANAFKSIGQSQREVNLFSFESKSMTQASNLTGDPLPSLGSNMILRPMEGNHLSALIPVSIVGSGSVTYMREATPLSSSGSFGFQQEGSAKPQIDYNIVTINQELQFLAATCKVSRQFLSNVPELQSYLSRSLSEDYKNALDTYCYQSLTANAVAGVSSESVPAAKLLDFTTMAAWAGRGVSGIAIGVSAWASVLKSAPSSGPYSVPGGVTFTPEGGAYIFSYPVYVIPSMPANAVLVGNFARGCSLATSTIFGLRTSDSDQDDFIKNMLTVRAESLLTLMVYSPSAFVSGTIS